MYRTALKLCASLLATASLTTALPQGPNTVAANNPNVRTASINSTYFIIPIPTTSLQPLVPYPLLPVPTSDTSLFPSGFPAGSHPLFVYSGYENDIRMIDLTIPSLLGANILVPYVDRLGDSKTPFAYTIHTYIGGVNGADINALVPVLVGGATSATPVAVGTFDPNTAAYASDGNDIFSASIKELIVPNPVSGPAITPSVLDFVFTNTVNPLYTPHTFHSIANQPIILGAAALSNGTASPDGSCQYNAYFFNQTFTEGVLREGNVTLYAAPAGADPAAIAGFYENVGGYSASSEQVGYNAQDCRSAAELSAAEGGSA